MKLSFTPSLANTPLVDKSGNVTLEWRRFFSQWFNQASLTATTIVIPKLTGGGSNGSVTVNENGIVTGFVQPT